MYHFRIKYLFALLLFGSQFPLAAQHTNIRISNQNQPNEVSICINPKNTSQLVAGANLREVFTSNDGGQTWKADTLNSTYGVWGDPVIVCDTTGAFYYLHLSNPPSSIGGSWIDRIVVQKTDSLGKTWSNGSFMGKNGSRNQDKEWAAIDPKNNSIYVTWTEFDRYINPRTSDSTRILFSRSADGGNTWTSPKRINKINGKSEDGDSAAEGAVPCVGPNGEVYVVWCGPGEFIYFNRSADGGNSWLPQDKVVSDLPGGWDYSIPGLQRCNGLPATACDLSNSPYRGTIYVNWTDQRNGINDADVWLTKSTNGGNTWSAPKRVNNDGPGKQQFMSWMCVDQSNGWIYVVFYDRRNYTNNNTDVYMAVSKDGGNTFEDFRISQSSFLPQSTAFLGDYINITAHNKVIRPIWTRMDNGNTSAWTALIDTAQLGTGYEAVLPFEQSDLYPNPSSELIHFSYKLRQTDDVKINLYNGQGTLITQLINKQQQPAGKYLEELRVKEFGLTPGVYVLQVITGSGQVRNQKFIIGSEN